LSVINLNHKNVGAKVVEDYIILYDSVNSWEEGEGEEEEDSVNK